mmetsp:Transcript_33320/g.102903  ORF Transcript_33320/g.102903 Transcript_33320/m.102903 type:complete len:293 (-) Transcript_33320:797-1675(-)
MSLGRSVPKCGTVRCSSSQSGFSRHTCSRNRGTGARIASSSRRWRLACCCRRASASRRRGTKVAVCVSKVYRSGAKATGSGTRPMNPSGIWLPPMSAAPLTTTPCAGIAKWFSSTSRVVLSAKVPRSTASTIRWFISRTTCLSFATETVASSSAPCDKFSQHTSNMLAPTSRRRGRSASAMSVSSAMRRESTLAAGASKMTVRSRPPMSTVKSIFIGRSGSRGGSGSTTSGTSSLPSSRGGRGAARRSSNAGSGFVDCGVASYSRRFFRHKRATSTADLHRATGSSYCVGSH